MSRPRSFAEAVEVRAHTTPDSELIRIVGGDVLSSSELLDRAIGLAASLASMVAAGDVVATALPSGPEAAALTTAISWLHAVELPMPKGLDPEVGRRLASATGCVASVVAPERLGAEPHLSTLGAHTTRPLLTLGGDVAGLPRVDDLPARPTPAHRAALDAPAAIMVTSGTGGRPKGALLPNGAGLGQAERVRRAMAYDDQDVLYNVFAWQHVNARHAAFLPAVLSGARLVIDSFSVSRFWRTVAHEEVTAFNFMGAVCAMLLRQPASPDDRLHAVSQAYGGPAPAWLHAQVSERFGVELRQAYACTELGDVATTSRGVRPGSAGQIVPEHELRIVDEHGTPMTEGSTGIVQVRPAQPNLAFTEYVGDPVATLAAWSDGWFITGDRGRLDDGWFWHEGRAADVIRRRGLTIDAERLEQVAQAHPDIEQAAAVGVPSELTDDEVLLVVVPRAGSRADPAEVQRHCAVHLPPHAVPRYVSVETSIPRNGSLKIVHRELRDRGLPPTAWDAEASVIPQENL